MQGEEQTVCSFTLTFFCSDLARWGLIVVLLFLFMCLVLLQASMEAAIAPTVQDGDEVSREQNMLLECCRHDVFPGCTAEVTHPCFCW